jgi:hypothetical protein
VRNATTGGAQKKSYDAAWNKFPTAETLCRAMSEVMSLSAGLR